MDSEERFDLTDDTRKDAEREEIDTTYDASATGLAGVPRPGVTEETSKTGVAGSSTFDPRVSPAHEGLAGSSSRDVVNRDVAGEDLAFPDTSDEQSGVMGDEP